jgi:hypothetical protein
VKGAIEMTLKKPMFAIAALATLVACGGPTIKNVQVGDLQVREVPANGSGSKHPDGKLSLFVFIPVMERPFENRIAVTQQYLAGKGCKLGTTDRDTLRTLTRNAGAVNKILMAPVKC